MYHPIFIALLVPRAPAENFQAGTLSLNPYLSGACRLDKRKKTSCQCYNVHKEQKYIVGLAHINEPVSTSTTSTKGVATAWTVVDMSTPLLPEGVPEIDANPVSFYSGGEGLGVGHGFGA